MKMKLKTGSVVLLVMFALIAGPISVYACGPLCVLGLTTAIGAVAWVALHPGSSMCMAAYGPDSTKTTAIDGPDINNGYFSSHAACSLTRGEGYYAGKIAVRGTLQPSSAERSFADPYYGISEYATSGLFSGEGKIMVLTKYGTWVTVKTI